MAGLATAFFKSLTETVHVLHKDAIAVLAPLGILWCELVPAVRRALGDTVANTAKSVLSSPHPLPVILVSRYIVFCEAPGEKTNATVCTTKVFSNIKTNKALDSLDVFKSFVDL